MAPRETPTVSIGDWIEAYSPGIWQVQEMLGGFYEVRFRLEERKRASRRSIVFAKRLVDTRWRKAFTVETCEGGWVRPLTDAKRERLAEYMTAHPEVVAEFEAFRPERPGYVEEPPRIANGRLTLKEAPGLGLALSEAALNKFGERIL